MVQSLFKYIQAHKKVYLIGLLLAIISGVIFIIPNYILQRFIDEIIQQKLTHQSLILYCGIFLMITLMAYFLDMIWVKMLFKQSYNYQKELRMNVFNRLLVYRRPFYQRFRSGDLMTRMTSDIDELGATMSYGVLIMVSDCIWLIMVFIYLLVAISWKLTLMSTFPLIFFGVTVFYVGKAVDHRYTASRDAVAELSNEVLEVVEGVRVMRAYGRRDLEQERFQARTQTVVDKANHQYAMNALYTPTIRFFTGISMMISLGYGAIQVNSGLISLGQLIAFQIYLGIFLYTIWGISDIFALYQTGKVSYRKISELLEDHNISEASGNRSTDHIESIEFNHYWFDYPETEQSQLKDINLTIHKGQTLGVVGKTGSGKTTLLIQLLRQFPVDGRGSLKLNGHNIQEYQIAEIENLIGYVPQEHILFSKSVKENILFGKENANLEELDQAIQQAHFTADIEHLSAGLETLIGEKGVSISGGQKQRISIARALIKQPELLILDDSLSAVDAKTEKAIIAQIREIRQDKTNIIVTHRLSAVANADQVIVLENGRIVEQGSPQTLLNQSGWFKEQYIRQQMEE